MSICDHRMEDGSETVSCYSNKCFHYQNLRFGFGMCIVDFKCPGKYLFRSKGGECETRVDKKENSCELDFVIFETEYQHVGVANKELVPNLYEILPTLNKIPESTKIPKKNDLLHGQPAAFDLPIFGKIVFSGVLPLQKPYLFYRALVILKKNTYRPKKSKKIAIPQNEMAFEIITILDVGVRSFLTPKELFFIYAEELKKPQMFTLNVQPHFQAAQQTRNDARSSPVCRSISVGRSNSTKPKSIANLERQAKVFQKLFEARVIPTENNSWYKIYKLKQLCSLFPNCFFLFLSEKEFRSFLDLQRRILTWQHRWLLKIDPEFLKKIQSDVTTTEPKSTRSSVDFLFAQLIEYCEKKTKFVNQNRATPLECYNFEVNSQVLKLDCNQEDFFQFYVSEIKRSQEKTGSSLFDGNCESVLKRIKFERYPTIFNANDVAEKNASQYLKLIEHYDELGLLTGFYAIMLSVFKDFDVMSHPQFRNIYCTYDVERRSLNIFNHLFSRHKRNLEDAKTSRANSDGQNESDFSKQFGYFLSNVKENRYHFPNSKSNEPPSIENERSDFTRESTLALTSEQTQAVGISLLVDNACIGGAPGTGKTLLIRVLEDIFNAESRGPDKMLTLTLGSGMASELRSKGIFNAITIHSALYHGYARFFNNADYLKKSAKSFDDSDADRNIDYDRIEVVVVDEFSNVDDSLFEQLLDPVLFPNLKKMIFVFDPFQTGPIGQGRLSLDFLTTFPSLSYYYKLNSYDPKSIKNSNHFVMANLMKDLQSHRDKTRVLSDGSLKKLLPLGVCTCLTEKKRFANESLISANNRCVLTDDFDRITYDSKSWIKIQPSSSNLLQEIRALKNLGNATKPLGVLLEFANALLRKHQLLIWACNRLEAPFYSNCASNQVLTLTNNESQWVNYCCAFVHKLCLLPQLKYSHAHLESARISVIDSDEKTTILQIPHNLQVSKFGKTSKVLARKNIKAVDVYTSILETHCKFLDFVKSVVYGCFKASADFFQNSEMSNFLALEHGRYLQEMINIKRATKDIYNGTIFYFLQKICVYRDPISVKNACTSFRSLEKLESKQFAKKADASKNSESDIEIVRKIVDRMIFLENNRWAVYEEYQRCPKKCKFYSFCDVVAENGARNENFQNSSVDPKTIYLDATDFDIDAFVVDACANLYPNDEKTNEGYLNYGWSITVNFSQGKEYDEVLFALIGDATDGDKNDNGEAAKNQTRNLFGRSHAHVATSRCKQKFYYSGSDFDLKNLISNQKSELEFRTSLVFHVLDEHLNDCLVF